MAARSVEREQDEVVLEQLRRHALRLAASFDLPLRALLPESPRVKRRYGVCFQDGTVKIRLRHARTGRFLRESSLVDTLCHELAHLRHFNHGRQFRRLYERILAYARRQGIYRPGRLSRWKFESRQARGDPPAAARPVGRPEAPIQLDLFRSAGE